MNEMIERIARAIWNQRRASVAELGIDLEEWGDGGIPRANKVFEEARAAIEAMREPTEAMLKASDSIMGGGWQNSHSDAETWDAMIDAALTIPSTNK